MVWKNNLCLHNKKKKTAAYKDLFQFVCISNMLILLGATYLYLFIQLDGTNSAYNTKCITHNHINLSHEYLVIFMLYMVIPYSRA